MSIKAQLQKPFVTLATWGATGTFYKHVAYLAAGWLALVLPSPSSAGKPITPAMLIVSALLLLAIVSVLGVAVGQLQGIFVLLGRLPAEAWVASSVVGLNYWRYAVGRKALLALEVAR